jgi:hypothetical protein
LVVKRNFFLKFMYDEQFTLIIKLRNFKKNFFNYY